MIARAARAEMRPAALAPWMSERERLVEDAARALRHGRGTFVVGSAGVGTSHFAELVLRTSGMTAATAPPVAGTAEHRPAHKAVSRSLGLHEPPPPSRDQLDRLRSATEALDVVRSWLPDLGRDDRAPVLRIDSAHVLGQPYADAVSTLARRGEITLLATARPVAGSQSPWHELWREDVVDRVDLGDLTMLEVRTMLASELGPRVDPDTVRRLWVETGGNARYLHQLVADQREVRTLVEHDGVWVLTDEPRPGQQLLLSAGHELDGLDDTALRALEAIELLGPLTLGAVLDVVDRDVLEELLARGVVRTTTEHGTETRVETAHRLLGRVVRSRVAPAGRHALLQHLGGPATGGPLTSQEVSLMLSDGMTVTPAVVRSAAAAARAEGRLQETVGIVDAALQETREHTWREVEVVALLADRAAAQRDLGRPERALADVEGAAPRLRLAVAEDPHHTELPRLVLELSMLRADLLAHHHDDVDESLDALAEGLRLLASLPTPSTGHEIQLEISRLSRLAGAGRHAEALDEAVRLLDHVPHPRMALRLVCPTGLGLLQAGRFDDVRRILRRYRPLAATAHDGHEASADVSVIEFLATLWAGEITPLEEVGEVPADAVEGLIHRAVAPIGRGLLAAACGAWSAARRELRAANAGLADTAVAASGPYARAAEALAAAASGEHDDARALLRTLEQVPRPVTAVLSGELRLLRLDTQMWLRDAAAPRVARALSEWASAASLSRIELEALHRWIVLERRAGVPVDLDRLARLHALLHRAPSPRATAIVRHAESLREDDVDLIGIAERELNRRGLWLPLGPPSSVLTAREREIAALARARLTSRTIAARLGLSARTVDSHLANAFLKLGIRSREDLVRALC